MADPMMVASQVEKIKLGFGIKEVVLVGDREMLTSARIESLKPTGLGPISALRSTQIDKLVRSWDLQLWLFDQQGLAEIASPDLPGDGLVVCRNPHLAKAGSRLSNSASLAPATWCCPRNGADRHSSVFHT